MDKRRYILFSFVLAIILVQGTAAASIISPSLKAFVTEFENKYDRASIDEDQMQKEDTRSTAMAVHPNIFIEREVFPLVAIDAGEFGSKVLFSDGDVGRVLNDFDNPSLAFWDVGIIDGEFDLGDVVYYHINQSSAFVIEQNDIRLTGFGKHFPGSKVKANDVDFNKALRPFPSSEIKFVDQYGSRGYDLMDPIYFSINNNSSQIIRMDLRLSHFAYGPAGTLVNGHDPDQGLATTNIGCKLKFYNINGNVRSNGTAIYDQMDPVYLDVSGRNEPGFVVVNDVRLS
jgi:hypothetical protein